MTESRTPGLLSRTLGRIETSPDVYSLAGLCSAHPSCCVFDGVWDLEQVEGIQTPSRAIRLTSPPLVGGLAASFSTWFESVQQQKRNHEN